MLGRTAGLRTPNEFFNTLKGAAGQTNLRLPSESKSKAVAATRDPIALLDAEIGGTKLGLNQRSRLVSDLFARTVRRANLPTATAEDVGFKNRLRAALAAGKALDVLKFARKQGKI